MRTYSPPATRPDVLGPLRCFHCGVTASVDVVVYQRITIGGAKQDPMCTHCAIKADRVARMSRRPAVVDCD